MAGSDNHGWGNTASGWTLVRVPGWRVLTPAALAVQLEVTLATGRASTRVVERRTPLLLSKAAVALTVPVMLLTVARGLSLPERLSWVAWAWSIVLVRLGLRRAAQAALERARRQKAQRRRRSVVVPIGPAMGLQS